MRPEISRPGDVPALRALWKQAFGDGDDCLDPFFTKLYRPEDAFVVREKGAVAAMAFQLPMTVCYRGRSWAAAYLYAVATREDARGKGCCSALLDFAAKELERRGVKALLLVPGGPSLREFYRARGFSDFSTADRFETEDLAGHGEAGPVSPPVYRELRERFLRDLAYVSCPVPVLAFQERVAGLSGGGLYRLSDGRNEGCACAAAGADGRAVIYELLWHGDRARGASLAARAVGAKRALVRAPGTGAPFAMAKWLCAPPELPAPYLGIALD